MDQISVHAYYHDSQVSNTLSPFHPLVAIHNEASEPCEPMHRFAYIIDNSLENESVSGLSMDRVQDYGLNAPAVQFNSNLILISRAALAASALNLLKKSQ
jgi:hypothetical protein